RAVPGASLRSARGHFLRRGDAVGDAGGPPLLEWRLRPRDRGSPGLGSAAAGITVSHLGLPAGVAAICARALERDCNRRFATAAEMETEIEQVLTGSSYAFERPLARA